MKLIPASSAAWMIRIDSSWSRLPQAPNIIAPRHSGLTLTPVRPRVRNSTPGTLTPTCEPEHRLGVVRGDAVGPGEAAANAAMLDHEAFSRTGSRFQPV